ncbi:MAG: DNA adenine methylase [archaeon]
MNPARSPLRYPGGKSRALPQILPLVPEFREFREPFVGGGSSFLALKSRFPERKFWINDINEDLFLFWKFLRDENAGLVSEIRHVKEREKDGRALFGKLTKKPVKLSDFERAARFFILNRITFSGTIESGGYSEQAFKGRFTESSVSRLEETGKLLSGVKITNDDYGKSLAAPGEQVFIFLDPPYLSKTKSRLYGKKGDLHLGFDHPRFSKLVSACRHRWLITYDDSPEVRALFPSAKIKEWTLQYGMNNYKQGSAARGKELFIYNY